MVICSIAFGQAESEKSALKIHVDSLIKSTKEYRELVEETKYTMNKIRTGCYEFSAKEDTILFYAFILVPGSNGRADKEYGFTYSKKADKIINILLARN